MKHSQKRTFMDIEKMSSDEFKAFCRLGNKNHFTRIRKMPLQDLLFTMINRKGLTLALELRNYMKLAHPGVSISKPGYLKQRMKLNPDAFLPPCPPCRPSTGRSPHRRPAPGRRVHQKSLLKPDTPA